MEYSADTVPTHADLHHHGTLEALQTATDESSGHVDARAVAAHVVRQTTLVDVWSAQQVRINK